MTMTTPHRPSPLPSGPRCPPLRKAALIAGIAYIATFVFSIPVKFGLWTDVLDKPDWVLGAGSDSGVPLGALFEVLTAHHAASSPPSPSTQSPAVTANVPRSASSPPGSWKPP